MTYKQMIKHFGTATKAAKALKISRQAIHYWKLQNKIPIAKQAIIERMTNGKLKMEDINL